MRLRISVLFLLLIGLTLTLNNYAFAHKVNLFCYLEDGILNGEGYYSGGRPAQNAEIEVYSLNTDALVTKTETDHEGKFTIQLESADSLKVVMNAGQGHRAEFILDQEKPVSTAEIKRGSDKTVLESEIQHLIEKKVKPLEERIRNPEKQQSAPGITRVISGIGWIAGIFTLLYLIKKKNAL